MAHPPQQSNSDAPEPGAAAADRGAEAQGSGAGAADRVIDAPESGAAAATLAALLVDLTELRDYLSARGRHTFELAQRFLQNARRDSAERAYDERQATMLEYQHYIWHEIAGRVDQLLATYAPSADETAPADGGTPELADGGREG